MRAAHWDDYELIDASCGERLERWGEVILARPDPPPGNTRFGDRSTPGISVPRQGEGNGRFTGNSPRCGKLGTVT